MKAGSPIKIMSLPEDNDTFQNVPKELDFYEMASKESRFKCTGKTCLKTAVGKTHISFLRKLEQFVIDERDKLLVQEAHPRLQEAQGLWSYFNKRLLHQLKSLVSIHLSIQF